MAVKAIHRLKPALQLDVIKLRVASLTQFLIALCSVLSAAGTSTEQSGEGHSTKDGTAVALFQ